MRSLRTHAGMAKRHAITRSVLLLVFTGHVLIGVAGSGTDSLQRALTTAKQDSIRFDLLLALAGEYLDSDPRVAMRYCEQARDLCARTGRPGDLGEVEGWMGYVDEQMGHIPEAVAHYRTSLREAERLKDAKGQSTVLNNLAAIYMEQGLPDSAMAAHRRSLELRIAMNDELGQAVSLGNIGYLLAAQGRVGEAMEHYSRALRLYERFNDADGVATTLHNMASVHRDQGDLQHALTLFMRELAINDSLKDVLGMATTEDNIGNVLERDGRLDEAMEHYLRALELHESSNDQRGMGYSLRNIAGIEVKQGRADSALAHAARSLVLSREVSDKRGVASALLAEGSALEKLGHMSEALDRGRRALQGSLELGYPQLVRDAAMLLERLHRSAGRWKEALEMKDLYITMRDSVLSDDARRSTLRQQFSYEYEKKEAVLKADQARQASEAREALQRERNRRNMFLAAGVCVLLLAIGLFSRLRFVRRSRAAIQQERDVADGLLLNILPEEVALELKKKGHADARHFDTATILFTDFKGFTQVSEQVTPAELVAELNTCFKAFDGIMEKHGIEKIKTIGDAYMAAGGLPDPRNGAPVDVVNAALEMQCFMQQHRMERTAAGKAFFEMRVGIHTGPVVAGIVGVKKFQYDIWGDTVNTASRMESSGEVGQVNISASTYALVKKEPGLSFTPRGKVQAKGKGEMEMYFVERA